MSPKLPPMVLPPLDSVVPVMVAGAVTNDWAAELISGRVLTTEPAGSPWSRPPVRIGISMGSVWAGEWNSGSGEESDCCMGMGRAVIVSSEGVGASKG
jgi:hypothetical protein